MAFACISAFCKFGPGAATRSLVTSFHLRNEARILLGVTKVNFNQERGARLSCRTVKRRTTHPFKYLVPQKAVEHRASLTRDNNQFLDQMVKEKLQRQNQSPIDASLLSTEEKRPVWTADSVRIGLIGKKIGIIPYWTTKGKRGLMTLIHIPDNHVISAQTVAELAKTTIIQNRWWSFGMAKMVVGAQSSDPRKFSQNYCKMFEEANVLPKAKLTTMLCTEDALMKPGTPLTVRHFRVGDYVDVHGKTRDYGFQGVMFRWQMKGQPKRGTTKAHRRVGSIGRGRRLAGPLKGKKMPGHMGSERRCETGLKIIKIDYKNSVIFIRGPSAPGIVGSWLYIYDTRVKEKRPNAQNPPPFPTHYPSDLKEDEETVTQIYHPDIHRPSDPTVVYLEEDAVRKEVRTGAKLAKVRTKK